MASPIAPEHHVSLGGYAAKQCLERLRKEFDPAYPESWKDPEDAFTLEIMEAGNVFEQVTVRSALLETISSHLIIDTTKKMSQKVIADTLAVARTKTLVVFDSSRDPLSLNLREDLTHALCEVPGKVRVLWNPRLRKWRRDGNRKVTWSPRAAEPDLMFRHEGRSKVVRWGSIDVKFHHPFEGETKGRVWNVSPLGLPFPSSAKEEAHKGVVKKVDAMQLAHYQRALAFHGLDGEPLAGIIGKPLDDELKVVWLDLNEKLYERSSTSALAMYDEHFQEALDVASREIDRLKDPTLEPLSRPEWKSECHTCVWRTTCHDELSVQDHITLLPGITPARAKAHYAVGVTDVRTLARLDTNTARVVDAGVSELDDLIDRANAHAATPGGETLPAAMLVTAKSSKQTTALFEANVHTIDDLANLDPLTASYATKGATKPYSLVSTIDQARVVDYARVRKMTHVFRARGVETLNIPSPSVEIHVDMENAEHIYLWGVYVVWRENDRVRTTRKAFATFEANDAAEAHNTVEFWKYLQELIEKAEARHGAGSVKVFHYTAAEDRCLRHLATKHAGVKNMPTPSEVEALLKSDVWVDLYPVLTDQLVWPTEDLTLKSLAKYVRFMWRDEDPSGSNSVVWYANAINPVDPERAKWQQRIIDYNEDDCAATAALLSWLQRFGEVNNLAKKLSRVEDLEERYARSRR